MILPYTHTDGIPTMRDSDVMGLYDRMVKDGSAEMVFMDGQIKCREDFLRSMKNNQTMMAVVQVDGKAACVGWLNRIERKKAHLHFCLFKEHWGRDSVKIGRAWNSYMLNLGKPDYVFDVLYGLMPKENQFAINYIQKCGGRVVGDIPHGIFDARKGESVTAVLAYITRDCL